MVLHINIVLVVIKSFSVIQTVIDQQQNVAFASRRIDVKILSQFRFVFFRLTRAVPEPAVVYRASAPVHANLHQLEPAGVRNRAAAAVYTQWSQQVRLESHLTQ